MTVVPSDAGGDNLWEELVEASQVTCVSKKPPPDPDVGLATGPGADDPLGDGLK